MAPERYRLEVSIVNPQGLHARPSAMIVKTANAHAARVSLTIDGKSADCRSIMEVMMLAAPQGTAVVVEAEGGDAAAAAEAVARLFRTGFGEG